MAIQEPSSPLWTAVKAVYDSSPPDLEEVATQAGDGWRGGVDVLHGGATQSTAAATGAQQAWMDPQGTTFAGDVTAQADVMGEIQGQMLLAAARADTYAQQLVSAKSTIVSTIATYEPIYALLGNPLFGDLGRWLQVQLATSIGDNLRDMIAEAAASLATGTPGTPPEQEPAPPPEPPAEQPDDGWSWSDIGHTALDVLGLVPVVGEAFDGVNAAWYASEGDWLNAGLSAAAMIPLAGWMTTGGKLGYKFVTNLDTLKTWAKNRPAGVPAGATQLPWTPNAKFPTGLKYQWEHLGAADPTVAGAKVGPTATPTRIGEGDAGRKVVWRAHGSDPGVAPGFNAAEGPVYRVNIGNHYLDEYGGKYTANALQANKAANDTHIPFDTRTFPAPDSKPVWMPPNPVAMGGPNSDED